MSAPKKKVRRPAPKQQAPAILKGIQPVDPQKVLSQVSRDELTDLMRDNFGLWAQYSGLEVDEDIFSFDEHRYLLDLYHDRHKEIVWMKSAQMGATIYEILRLLWFCRHHTVKAGLYFPNADGVTKLAKDRLNPIIKSNPELDQAVDKKLDALGLKQIANIHGKKSSLYMLYLGGQSSKDSVPLDVLAFDEVRLCNSNDIDQAIERVSHSRYKYKMYVSTAGFPSQDIHARFLRGTQKYWHIKCSCLDGFIPSDCFPDCVVDTGKEVYLRCPKCKMRIHDPQNGCYIEHNPGADYPSYHISQFISKFISVKEIWRHYTASTNKKEFYNAKLGKPYVDEENMPVNDDILENCVNPDLKWLAHEHKKNKRNCAMGIDQHGGNIYVVISRRNPDTGKPSIVHLEIVDQNNPRYWEAGKPVSPFKRAKELMREFDIGMCVVDAMPNYNEAMDLGRDFPGRVYIAWYGGAQQKDMVQWMDRPRAKESIRRGSKNIQYKWQVTLNRYTIIDYTLAQFVDRDIEMPHPDALVQVVRNAEGRYTAENICRTIFWRHLKSIVRQRKTIDEKTGNWKMEWVYLGIDPHFLHSQVYATVALERLKRQAIILM